MTKLIPFLLVSLTTFAAGAYPTGTLQCRNRLGLPNNEYKISHLENLDSVPFVEITRYFRLVSGDATSPQQQVKIRGFAAVSEIGSRQLLTIGEVRLEFIDGQLTGCQQ